MFKTLLVVALVCASSFLVPQKVQALGCEQDIFEPNDAINEFLPSIEPVINATLCEVDDDYFSFIIDNAEPHRIEVILQILNGDDQTLSGRPIASNF